MNNSNTTNIFFNGVTKLKVGLAFAFLCLVLFVVLIPYFMISYYLKRKYQKGNIDTNLIQKILSICNCFAAGVFLTTGILDIFIDVLTDMNKAIEKYSINTEFPLGAFIVICGIFMILYIEEGINLLQFCSKNKPLKFESKVFHSSHSENVVIERSSNQLVYNTFSKETQKVIEESPDSKINKMGLKILIVAVAVHSIFEGLALGLQITERDTLLLFMAISIHKSVLAFTIGLEMAQIDITSKIAIMFALIFSISSPIGICIGFTLVYYQNSDNPSLLMGSAILQGLACGTFFYIVFFEILPHELLCQKNRLTKILSLTIGFILVSALIFILH